MSKVYIPSVSIANFTKATFSLWVNIPAAYESEIANGFPSPPSDTPFGWQNQCEFLVCGDYAGNTNTTYCYISLTQGDNWFNAPNVPAGAPTAAKVARDSTTWSITAYFDCGVDTSNLTANYVSGNYDSPAYVNQNNYAGFGPRIDIAFGHCAFISPFTFDEWHHIFVAADLSHADTFGNFPYTSGGFHVPNVPSSFSRNRIIEIYFDGVRATGRYETSAKLPPPNGTSNPDWNDVGWQANAPSAVVPAVVNGYEFSMPTFVETTYNPGIRYAACQIWLGQYIPPGNLGSFIDVDGGLVLPNVAQRLYGSPTFLFDGGAATFAKNQSGGSTTLQGTLDDYAPYPRLSTIPIA
jgi:hypothetical protein